MDFGTNQINILSNTNRINVFSYCFKLFCMKCNCVQHTLLIQFTSNRGGYWMSKNFYNLFIELEKLDDIFNNSLIVVDTNVLLMAYQWRDTTFERVYKILNELTDQNRLIIPAQVIKEFANKRPQTIRDLCNDLHDKILSKLEKGKSDHQSLNRVIPGLEFFEDKEELINAEKKYNDAIQVLKTAQKDYKDSLNNHLNKIKGYIDNDPILLKFKDIFERAVLDEIKHNQEELEKDAERRKKENIPPGYKDKGHIGDLKIWKEILSLSENNVIFITRDNKNDWVYKDNKNNIMGARRELVEEFYSLHNKTFKMLSPLDFIAKYSKDNGLVVDKELKEDIGNSNVSVGNNTVNIDFNENESPSSSRAFTRKRAHRLANKASKLIKQAYSLKIIDDEDFHDFLKDLEYGDSFLMGTPSVAEDIYTDLLNHISLKINLEDGTDN